MSKIKGIYAASMSILDNNLTLNIDKTIKHSEKIIDQGCHGVAIFGSTGQAQLISVGEKISLLNHLSESRYKDKYLIGTGSNSLSETINLMKISSSLNIGPEYILSKTIFPFFDKLYFAKAAEPKGIPPSAICGNTYTFFTPLISETI